jgi:hypothetical protein
MGFFSKLARLAQIPPSKSVEVRLDESLASMEMLNGPAVITTWTPGEMHYCISFGPKAATLQQDTLAGIMSHELGHIHLGHLSRLLTRRDLPPGGIQIGEFLVVPEFELEADLFAARLGHAGVLLKFLEDTATRFRSWPIRHLANRDATDLINRRIAQLKTWVSCVES